MSNGRLEPISDDDVDFVVTTLRHMVCAIVDDEKAVRISHTISKLRINLVLEVEVAKQDMAFVMGVQGRNAEAIKTIMKCVDRKLRVDISVSFTERK